MSHIVTIEVELKNKESVVKACERLSWPCTADGSASFYDGKTIHGVVVKVPGWQYPAVIKDNGTIAADTYNNRWGDIKELDRLKQLYSIEEAKSTFSRQGLYGSEQENQDGSITLTAEVYQ